MRTEIKARHEGSLQGRFVRDGLGVTTAIPLVGLLVIPQLAGRFLDQVCPPISHLKFEPFGHTVRPNGLKEPNTRRPQG
jgi:hypothetical protein